MQNSLSDRLTGLRFILIVTIFLTLGAVVDQFRYALEIQILAISWKWRLALLIGGVILAVEIAILFATWTPLSDPITRWANNGAASIGRLSFLRYPLIVFLLLILPFLVLGPYGYYFHSICIRALVFWFVVIFNSLIIQSMHPNLAYSNIFFGIALMQGVLYRIAVFLPDLSSYPFSLGWSEASRYFYASLFFSERIYGVQISPSVLHPTRYLLQSIPFLLPGSTLWTHRLWQVVLWLATTFVASYLLTKRLKLKWGWSAVLAMAWAFLFFFQGPVYYHLQIMVILVLWGFNREKPLRTTVIVLVASAWAGISRINWAPVPGLLGALLYFFEIPRNKKPAIRYLTWPVFLFLSGSTVAFLSQSAYVLLSGQDVNRFTSSLGSQLLWYRLLPNATYPLGVLPAIFTASLPIFLLMFYHWRSGKVSMAPLRQLGVFAIALMLFGGGLVVSTKIGGGSNLHNLDAYLVVLAVSGLYIFAGGIEHEADGESQKFYPSLPIKGLLVSVPILFVLGAGATIVRYDAGQAQRALDLVQEYAQGAAIEENEVLFISQRHLLTFDIVQDIPLVPEYETVFLMEMAMSGNQAYLDNFYNDLREGRFGLIIVATLERDYQGRSHAFGEENDAWVREVSEPILCFYAPLETLDSPRLQLLVPMPEADHCTP
ncbi:MAG: hypothetical protein WBB65_00265 [Anaerolineales bacterium]